MSKSLLSSRPAALSNRVDTVLLQVAALGEPSPEEVLAAEGELSKGPTGVLISSDLSKVRLSPAFVIIHPLRLTVTGKEFWGIDQNLKLLIASAVGLSKPGRSARGVELRHSVGICGRVHNLSGVKKPMASWDF